ncbi:MAG: serine/threonine protein kinase [Planctomycetaceae bacterium]|nr:serine/threonine protein kinase [Planctomycetaceae bacterium]
MSDLPSSREPAVADPDLSGLRLGNYQLLRRLGRGGMADVYLAEQISLHRQVAFKVLRRSLADDQAYVHRFHNEARAAASLVHANIVQIYEVGCIDGIHFIAQEYVAGQNLKQWLARHRTADAQTAVHIMRQVVAALSRASQQGTIHRDIKPENIMLARTGEVKVADFGLARIAAHGPAVNLTQVGVTMGTPLYMSPEQVEGRAVDPRSDLYSFGVTSYEMLAGRPPFEGETPLSVAVQHLRSDPPPLAQQRPDLPDGLCRIVHRLLAKKPADRYQTPSDVMRDLRDLHLEGLDQWPSGADEWDVPESLSFVPGRSAATLQLAAVMRSQSLAARRHTRRLWVAAAIVAGLLAGAGAAWLNRPASLLDAVAIGIEKKDTVTLQYWHAMKLNTAEAWLAVERYFPPDDPVSRMYAWQAKQRLAELYRRNNQLDHALQVYTQLAGSDEPQYAAYGLLGRASLLDQQGQRNLATAELAEAVEQISQLPEEQISGVLQWLDPDLDEIFLFLAAEDARLKTLPLELWMYYRRPQSPNR